MTMMMTMITTTTTMIHDSGTGMMTTILTIPRSEGGRGFICILNLHYKQVTSRYEYFFFNEQSLRVIRKMDVACVLCEVQIEFLFTNLMNASLQRTLTSTRAKTLFRFVTKCVLSQTMTLDVCACSVFIVVCHFCMNQFEEGIRCSIVTDWYLQIYSQLNRQIVLKYPV